MLKRSMIVLAAVMAGAAANAASGSFVAGKARFTPLTERMIRCEWSESGVFEDRPSFTFVNRNVPKVEYKVEKTAGGGLVLKTARTTLEWRGGAFTEANLFVNGVAVLSEDRENLLGTTRTLDGVWGFKQLIPKMEKGILSRRGVTVIDDTKTPLFVKTNDHWGEWVAERPTVKEGDYRDLVVFAYGHDYKGALKDYTLVAGKIPLPPRWAFGYWWSRYWLYTDSEVRELIDRIKLADVPIDVFILDMEWHETWGIGDRPDRCDEFGQLWGWTGYTWNRRLFPKPESTLEYLHSKGCKVALNIHPASGIQPVEECYETFKRDYGWQGDKAVPYHATDAKWTDCYFKDVLGPLEEGGVDFWWLDWQQWLQSKYMPSVGNTFWLNHLFFKHRGELNGGKLRPFIYHRWGGYGSHRYQVGFSGDTGCSWDVLAAIPWFTATSANVGYGYWGHDIGGHNPYEKAGLDGELYTRWLQSGVFTPIFKTHSSKTAMIERRIWKYPEHQEYLREAMKLRYRLAPYIYTAAREAYDTGVSICRPMYYDWPETEAAYSVTNAYMFGDSILAATISRPMDKARGVSELEVWLPEGKWYDVSAGELIEGGRKLKREYAIFDNPWFIKAGAIIPMYPKSVRNLAKIGTKDLEFLFAPGADKAEALVYEDAGDTNDYDRKYRFTKVTREGSRIVIAPRKGAYTLRFPCMAAPRKVLVNGKSVGYSFDPKEFAIVVKTPVMDGAANTVVELVMGEEADEIAAKMSGLKRKYARINAVTEELKEAFRRQVWCRNLPDSWQVYWQTPARIAAEPTELEKHLALAEKARLEFLGVLDRYASEKMDSALVVKIRELLK